MKMLNQMGSNTDHCGTPNKSCSQSLNIEPILTLQSRTKITWTTAKNGVVPDTTSNVQPI